MKVHEVAGAEEGRPTNVNRGISNDEDKKIATSRSFLVTRYQQIGGNRSSWNLDLLLNFNIRGNKRNRNEKRAGYLIHRASCCFAIVTIVNSIVDLQNSLVSATLPSGNGERIVSRTEHYGSEPKIISQKLECFHQQIDRLARDLLEIYSSRYICPD